jgi:hypothetical protein
LTRWLRSMHITPGQPTATVTDEFTLSAPGRITHRIWFVDRPSVRDDATSLDLAEGITLTLDTRPAHFELRTFRAGDTELSIRSLPSDHVLYRAEWSYDCLAGEPLRTRTTITA